MAPKNSGGAGQKSAQNYVTELWQQGLPEEAIRKQLKEDGYKAGRISQLLKATRPAEGQEGVAAAAAKVPARPAKRPAAAKEAGALHFFLAAANLFCFEEDLLASGPRTCCEAACNSERVEGHS